MIVCDLNVCLVRRQNAIVTNYLSRCMGNIHVDRFTLPNESHHLIAHSSLDNLKHTMYWRNACSYIFNLR